MAEMNDHHAKKPEACDIDPASAGPHALVRYDEMCRAIAEAYRVDEVKDIRDRAMAFALYARQPNNHDAELQAIQIRVRAERRAGELSKELPRGAGNQHASPHGAEKQKLLANAGISTQQASEWERLADVPEEEFELAITTSDVAPNARRIVYDHVALHGRHSEPAIAEKTLTGADLQNEYLEGEAGQMRPWLKPPKTKRKPK